MSDDLSTPGKRLAMARRLRGFETQAELINAFALKQSTLSVHESGGRGLTLAAAKNYGAMLHVSAGWLLTGEGPAPQPKSNDEYPPIDHMPLMVLPGGEAGVGPRDPGRFKRGPERLIPVRSAGRGGLQEDRMYLQDGPVDWIPAPAKLLNVADAYAIFMMGDSMNPRFRHGQKLYIDPGMPWRKGLGLVIFFNDDSVLIKDYVSSSNRLLVVEQYNPPKTMKFDRGDLRHADVIVSMDEA